MKKLATLSLALLAGFAINTHAASWSYEGETGPNNWAKLSPENSACAGSNQSPINLTRFIDAKLAPIQFDYRHDAQEILNNGHTIQVNMQAGSSIKIDGISFELKQFHLHAPSENLINGKSFPMELHLVHADKDGNLAVIGVMMQEGKANPAIAQAWAQMPKTANEKIAITSNLSATALLPRNRDYYRFNGSLTTPPCTEGVRWLVMKHPITVSKAQIEAFTHVIHPNNRPIQPIKARPVLE